MWKLPGVTVERKEGVIKKAPGYDRGGPAGNLFPLPIRRKRLSPGDFLLKDKPDGIINIVDATNIERISIFPCSLWS